MTLRSVKPRYSHLDRHANLYRLLTFQFNFLSGADLQIPRLHLCPIQFLIYGVDEKANYLTTNEDSTTTAILLFKILLKFYSTASENFTSLSYSKRN